jgi:hypothetical protein
MMRVRAGPRVVAGSAPHVSRVSPNAQHQRRRSVRCMLLLGGPGTTLASRHVASATPAVTSSASGVTAASQQPSE